MRVHDASVHMSAVQSAAGKFDDYLLHRVWRVRNRHAGMDRRLRLGYRVRIS